jgi:hypothetical protein
MTLDEIKAAMKGANCAADRLANGNGCQCTVFGRGAGLGWTVSVICDGEELSWTVPPGGPHDGVGFVRDFTCDTLRQTVRDMLELLDRERAKEMPVDPQSWQWPSSFFADEQGIPLHETEDGRSANWIRVRCDPVPGPPYTLESGDIILFSGANPRVPGNAISHSAIATGRGDEISHMWWTREIQAHMLSDRTLTPRSDDPSPQQGGYTVTRDSLADIQKRFTYPAFPPPPPVPVSVPTPPIPTPTPPGEPALAPPTPRSFLTNEYTVWRIRDRRRAHFGSFFGCP